MFQNRVPLLCKPYFRGGRIYSEESADTQGYSYIYCPGSKQIYLTLSFFSHNEHHA